MSLKIQAVLLKYLRASSASSNSSLNSISSSFSSSNSNSCSSAASSSMDLFRILKLWVLIVNRSDIELFLSFGENSGFPSKSKRAKFIKKLHHEFVQSMHVSKPVRLNRRFFKIDFSESACYNFFCYFRISLYAY